MCFWGILLCTFEVISHFFQIVLLFVQKSVFLNGIFVHKNVFLRGVFSHKSVKSKSLKQFVTIDHADKKLEGLRCSMKPFVDQEWMENIPLYSVLGYMGRMVHKE